MYQIEEPLGLGRTIPYGVGATATCTGHSANGGPRSGVEGEEERDTFLGKMGVNVLPLDTGLDGHIAVFLGNTENLVHIAQVERDSAVRLPVSLRIVCQCRGRRTLEKCPSRLVPPL